MYGHDVVRFFLVGGYIDQGSSASGVIIGGRLHILVVCGYFTVVCVRD